MTASILAALTTALFMGFWFNSTRPMSIAAAAAMTYMYPQLLVLVLIGSALAVWHHYLRK